MKKLFFAALTATALFASASVHADDTGPTGDGGAGVGLSGSPGLGPTGAYGPNGEILTCEIDDDGTLVCYDS